MSSRAASRTAPGAHGVRLDIQGLRAFAVVAVIADHLFSWPHGGFVGVDIFFVISGFVITSTLLREHERTGRISFLGFYRRRVRRILPAALLVLVVTVASSYYVYGAPRADGVRTDGIWAALFAANWHFAQTGTDYFASTVPSPLQHFWSLSIEEQFYFVWPWLMLAVLTVLSRGGRARRTTHLVTFAVLVCIAIASFLWAVHLTGSDPTHAYFSTFTRVWELAVGAAVAIAAPLCTRIPTSLRPVLAWTGLAAMVASLWLVDAHSAFPAPAAALPVLATALVIAGGTGTEAHAGLFPLTSAPMAWVGDLSYSLYLWHFPIIILGTSLWGERNLTKLLLLVGIVIASTFAYYVWENEIRTSTWLTGRHDGEVVRPFRSRRWRLTATALAVSLGLAVALQAALPDHRPRTYDVAAATGGGPAQQALSKQISDALAASTWPSAVKEALKTTTGGAQAPRDVIDCSHPVQVDLSTCAWGSDRPSHSAVIVGDSVAMTYVNPIRSIIRARPGWRLYGMAAFGCTFTDKPMDSANPEVIKGCPGRLESAVASIKKLKPDVVFVVNNAGYHSRGGRGISGVQFSAEEQKRIAQIRPVVGKVVLLQAPPPSKEIGECYTPRSTPGDCVSIKTYKWKSQTRADRRAARTFDEVWVDTSRLFCVKGLCPAFVGSTPMKADITHMTPQYGEKITPALAELLVPILQSVE